MLAVLNDMTYRRLFSAQVIALLGTGLATVALGLLAYDLAGEHAGAVLGTALAIKMIAYVTLAPLASAVSERLPRRVVLIALDLLRASVALCLPFVTEVWQIYVLIFVLQAGSAGFTPTFQAAIPDILPDEAEYTRALSLSRLAYDLENLISPALAAVLLLLVGFPVLFIGTALGFVASATLILSVALPTPRLTDEMGVKERATRGLRIYLLTPRLRGLLAICLAVAATGAMVIVNTVVFVQSSLSLGPPETALALAAFGVGSMVAALSLPKILDRLPDRTVMLIAASLMAPGLFLTAFVETFQALSVLWMMLGVCYSAAQVPAGRLLRRSAQESDRTAIFAAHFALSHACWLITYPLAGYVGSAFGLATSAISMGIVTLSAAIIAFRCWPKENKDTLWHDHENLRADDPHWHGGHERIGHAHSHVFVIDRLHRNWPTNAQKRSIR